MAGGKRERLVAAAVQVFHEQGVEKTTLADVARVADVPLGNVYYYFKTKGDLVGAAVGEHASRLRVLTAALDELPDPAARLKALIDGWVDQRDVSVRYGCPFGTLATELEKRGETFDADVAAVMHVLLDWAEAQFRELGRKDPRDLAVTYVAAYQGMSVLANTLRDPKIMVEQGKRLKEWVDTGC